MVSKKINYKAWDIELKDFTKARTLQEKINFLLGFAILAPSGHNTQPWLFKLLPDGVEIFVNKKRFLKQRDSSGRQTYISIGCMLENLCTAADYFGFSCSIEYFPKLDLPELIAKVNLTQKNGQESNPKHLVNYITKRHANRLKYTPDLPEKNIIEDISGVENSALSIIPVTGEKKNRLSELMMEALIKVMDDKEFRTELSNYIKPSITKSNYGMPGSTLGIPLPISFIASKLIKMVNMTKASKKQDTDLLIKHTQLILVISSSQDNKKDWIVAGQTLEKLWLNCTKYGLYCSPLAAAVQVPEIREQVKLLVGTNFYPQAILRCGYSKHKPALSPRFELIDLILET